jgi:hypothetical protein
MLPQRARPGDDLAMSFTAQAPAGGRFAVQLALRDGEGEAVAETTFRLSMAAGEQQPLRWQIALPHAMPTGIYDVAVAVTSDGVALPAHTPSGRYVAGRVAIARPQDVLPADTQPAGSPVGAVFGDRIELASAQMLPGPLPPGSSFPLILYWRALAAVGEDMTVFVHLVAPDGRIVAQADADPLGGRYPTSVWQPGEMVRDERRLQLPHDASGTYELRVGWYRRGTGERLRLPGVPGDALRLGTIEVAP